MIFSLKVFVHVIKIHFDEKAMRGRMNDQLAPK